jgi:hypothetical protein
VHNDFKVAMQHEVERPVRLATPVQSRRNKRAALKLMR